MPTLQASRATEDREFEPRFHRSGTKGNRGLCTIPGCSKPPVISRRWDNPQYPNGWWGAYCTEHR